jgi:hypothetical protein
VPIDRHRPEGRERPRNNTERLKTMLAGISTEINREAQERHGLKNLVNADGTLAMDGFAKSQGGIYPDAEIERNQGEIHQREVEFSGADKPSVQDFYRSQYGVDSAEGIIKRWRENKTKAKNGQTEMAVTAVLYKMLKDDFLVVRTSVYDDYMHGVDNLILDKRTGAVICAFDEVHEGGEGQRTADKREKVKKIAQKGGTRIRYGIGLEQGRLKRSAIENVPVFYLGLKSEELEALLANMNYDPDAGPSPEERQVFSQLVASLREQRAMLDTPGTPPAVKRKLAAFEDSLMSMEGLSQPQARAA